MSSKSRGPLPCHTFIVISVHSIFALWIKPFSVTHEVKASEQSLFYSILRYAVQVISTL